MSQHEEPDAAGPPPVASGPALLVWGTYCGGFVVWAGALNYLSHRFGYDREVGEMPILPMVALLVAAGVAYCALLPAIIRRSARAVPQTQHRLLALIIAAGFAARFILFGSEPILENDYQRYLWDGAVVAEGHNPYAFSPRDVIRAGADGPLGHLAVEGAQTLSRIGHKPLTTIYPPVAEVLFALAHVADPWSLTAWRGLLLVFDTISLGLLIWLLDLTGRHRLWIALYWLNPLVLKEGFNSAHMEPVLVPFLISAILLGWYGRSTASTLMLALAAGIKLWPAVLAPLLWRRLGLSPGIAAMNALLFGLLMGIWLGPLVLSGPADSAGLVAYAEGWSTNSALFPAVERLTAQAFSVASIDALDPNLAARMFMAATFGGFALYVAMRGWRTLDDLIRGAALLVMALVLLSPAQYPWYALWLAPLLVFWPHPAFLLLPATLPLYYLSFYFAARDAHGVFTGAVVWIIWCPVWLMLAREWPSALMKVRV